MKNKISKALELAEQSEVLTLGLSAGSSIQLWHEENAKELRRLDAVEKAADAVAEHFQQQIDRLRSELSTERMRLEACGVVARADTPESAAVARDMLRAEFHSKSCDDVARLVDECINLRSELEAARGKVEAAKLPEGKWSLGHRDGNWREIDHADHQAVMRIVWRMEDDDGPNHFLESQARAVVAALNDAAAPHHTPPNPPQHSHLSEAQRCTQD